MNHHQTHLCLKNLLSLTFISYGYHFFCWWFIHATKKEICNLYTDIFFFWISFLLHLYLLLPSADQRVVESEGVGVTSNLLWLATLLILDKNWEGKNIVFSADIALLLHFHKTQTQQNFFPNEYYMLTQMTKSGVLSHGKFVFYRLCISYDIFPFSWVQPKIYQVQITIICLWELEMSLCFVVYSSHMTIMIYFKWWDIFQMVGIFRWEGTWS